MKAWHFFLLIFLCSLGTLRAESELRMKGLESRIAHLEKLQTGEERMGRLTPCAGPRVSNGMDLSLSADFIYWTARLDSLIYGRTRRGDLSNRVEATKGRSLSVDWSWDPGFKASLGWSFCHGCWDMILQYTWLYTNVDSQIRSDSFLPASDFIPLSVSQNQVVFPRAQTQFDLHYQVGDLELGRNYYVSRTLKLRPFIGIKGTWQKQDYKVSYDLIPVSELNALFGFHAKFDHALWGLGMRGGLNTSWQFSKYVGLYGNMALTGIWLHYDISRKDLFQIGVGSESNLIKAEGTIFNVEDRLRLIKPVIECALGLRGESYFGCRRYHLLVQVGWECHIWPNQTVHMRTDSYYDRYDLNLHGLTAKMRFDF